MKILFLEPWYGGSHKEIALGYTSVSRHEIDLITLPDRFWKWRMRGASLYFADQIKNMSDYDLIFATDMMDLTDLKALAGENFPPVVLYFHENQLSYPLAPGQDRDLHLGFTNIVSAYSADRVLFNSCFHMDEFLKEASGLIRQMPDFRPSWMVESIREKAGVMHPGCRFDTGQINVSDNDQTPPLIIWNHRWEFDKQPELFFKALSQMKQKGIGFSLAVLGEELDLHPEIFDTAKEEFKDEIAVYGYLESHEAYRRWLEKGTVVISSAIQENFGVSIVEAVRHGCFPLLPERLAYPEIMPEHLHPKIMYTSLEDLVEKLEAVILSPGAFRDERQELSDLMAEFSWEKMADRYDDFFEDIVD